MFCTQSLFNCCRFHIGLPLFLTLKKVLLFLNVAINLLASMIVFNSTLLRQLGSDILKECHPVIKNSAHLQMFNLSVYCERKIWLRNLLNKPALNLCLSITRSGYQPLIHFLCTLTMNKIVFLYLSRKLCSQT